MSEPAVGVFTTAERPTIVVRATTTWAAFPTVWRGLLDEVYAVVREADGVDPGGPGRGWQNVMLYSDDLPTVEVGVLGGGGFAGRGRVVSSVLPAGDVARTVHRGPYAGLAAAHRAVLEWCAENGRPPVGPRWEVYGHWRENPAELETEISYLLA
jgi:effector-binding domain-containing protein